MKPTDANTLQNRTIMVTRPEHQAASFCQMLEGAGASALRCPLLRIAAAPETRALSRLAAEIDSFDLLIFNSPNAASFGIPEIEARCEFRSRVKIAAIGAKTAYALERLGYPVDIVPETGFDSESLLRLPVLENVDGKKIAILRGSGGRELAGSVLRARGAEVSYIQVYERLPAGQGQLEPIEDLLRHRGLDAVAITSGEAFLALWKGLSPATRQLLNQVTFVFGSERIADIAKAQGLRSIIVIADDPSDEAMFSALVNWAARVSKA